MIKVYGYPDTRSLRAVWALEEAGAHYEYSRVDLRKGEGRSPQFLSINPGGKVPVLIDGDLVLTESAAICMYVAERFPASKLTSHDAADRARVNQWCLFALTELEQPLWTLAKHTFALPEKYRVPAIFDTARWEFVRAAGVLAQGLGDRQFVVGNSFSIADLLLVHTLTWAKSRSIDLGIASLNDYVERISARPALARAAARERA